MVLRLFMILGVNVSVLSHVSGKATDSSACRGRLGTMSFSDFRIWECVMCYSYLYQYKGEFSIDESQRKLVATDDSRYTTGRTFTPDIANRTEFGLVCSTLGEGDCQGLTECCQSAVDCCHRQNSVPLKDHSDTVCTRTFDGYTCFDDTPSDTLVSKRCPSFITKSSNYAIKHCTEDGTWYKKGTLQWTNYTACYDNNGGSRVQVPGILCFLLGLVTYWLHCCL